MQNGSMLTNGGGLDHWLTPTYFPWLWWWRSVRQYAGGALHLLLIHRCALTVGVALPVLWLSVGH